MQSVMIEEDVDYSYYVVKALVLVHSALYDSNKSWFAPFACWYVRCHLLNAESHLKRKGRNIDIFYLHNRLTKIANFWQANMLRKAPFADIVYSSASGLIFAVYLTYMPR